MKVLLIQAPLGRTQKLVYPLGLAYLAAAVAPRHTVRILDASGQPAGELREAIRDFGPDVIGLGLRNIDTTQSHDRYFYFQHFPPFVTWLSRLAPRSTLVVGGTGFTLFPREVLQACPEIACGIEREGEVSFPALLDNLDTPQAVPGLHFRQGEDLAYSGPAPLPDLAALPAPLRLLHPRLYQEETFQLGVQTKRGCGHCCLYCNYPQLNGGALRLRQPGAVAEELQQLRQEHQIRRLAFADAIFNEPRDHALAICEELLRCGPRLRWTAYFTMRGFDRELLETAAQAGCELFEFSPDGLRQETLDGLQKGMAAEELEKLLVLFAERTEPRFALQLMFNVPGARARDFLRLAQAALLWPRRFPALDFVAITNMRIYPGTPLAELALAEGVIARGQSLLRPVFYDPWPLRPLSALIHIGGRVRRQILKWRGRYRF
jgi:5-methoxybenzimidazole methyltransferase